MKTPLTPEEYLALPYSRVVVPHSESKSFAGMILEFPGCFAQGSTVEGTYAELQKAALSWLDAEIAAGHEIPRPAVLEEHSGKIVLRMGKSLHRHAVEAARADNISLNQWLVAAVAERLGAESLYRKLAYRLRQRVFLDAIYAAQTAVTGQGVLTRVEVKPTKRWETH